MTTATQVQERSSVCGHCKDGFVPIGVTRGCIEFGVCPACTASQAIIDAHHQRAAASGTEAGQGDQV